MTIIVSYKEVSKKYPNEVIACINLLRSSKSKYKNETPEKLIWKYEYEVRGTFINLAENISNKLNNQEVEPILNRITSALYCSGETGRAYGVELASIPDVIKEKFI